MNCIVKDCNNKYKKHSKISFFKFPKEPHVLNKWIEFCGQPKELYRRSWCICSEHFKEEEIGGRLQKDMGFRGSLYIKTGVVPTRPVEMIVDEDRNERIQRREHKRIINSILKANPIQTEVALPTTPSSLRRQRIGQEMTVFVPEAIIDVPTLKAESINEENLDPINVATETTNFDSQLETLKNEVMKLRLSNQKLQADMSEKTEKHNVAITRVRRQLKELQVQCKNVDDKLKGIFTLNQIRILKNGQKNKKWTHADMANSVALYSASANGYNLLRKMDFPLPAVQALHDWAQKLDIKKGLLQPVFKILSETRHLTKKQKVCVLSFGEMKIQDTDVQVAMLRGLISKWKQPVFTEFNCSITAETIKNILAATKLCGYKVVAIVCDIEGLNEKLLKELEVHHEKPWFVFGGEKVYVFADVPCLIKSLRTYFLNEGFIIDGKSVQKNIIASLLTNKTLAPSIANKIGDSKHLEVCCGTHRQSVKLATKLFSNTVAQAVHGAASMGFLNGTNWQQCYKLLKTTNDWFDIMNVRIPKYNNIGRKLAYGLDLDTQNEVLVDMNKLIKEMRVKGNTLMASFQKGILQTNLALQLLYLDIKTHFQIDYVLTYHLSQDVLENVFQVIRSQEGMHDQLDRHKVLHSLRAYLLGQNESHSTTGNDVEIDDAFELENSKFPLTGVILSRIWRNNQLSGVGRRDIEDFMANL